MKLGLPSPGDTVHTIVVTSPGPTRGKAAIAANLAVAIAQAGRRVVLVDANLRAPEVDHLFGLPGRSGLAELLAGADGCVADYLVDGPVPDLGLLLAGSVTSEQRDQFTLSPLELGAGVERILAEFQALGHLVVIDAPPMLGAPEGLVFTRVGNRHVVVVQEGLTRASMLARAFQDVRATRMQTTRLVLADASW
jgi:Mrp family chromosome partitioning ATPase